MLAVLVGLVVLITDGVGEAIELFAVGAVVNVGLELVERWPEREERRLDTPEAAAIADARVEQLRRLPYQTLDDQFGGQSRKDQVTSGGRAFDVEVKAALGGWADGDVKVWVLVDDRRGDRFRPLRPLVRSFTVRPDGTLRD